RRLELPWIFRASHQVDETDDEQSYAEQQIRQTRPTHFAQRNEKLRIDRLEHGEVEPTGANELAELLRVGHEKSLHQRIDDPGSPHEYEELVFTPTRIATDRGRMLEDD